MSPAPDAPEGRYLPRRRTALVLAGTGTAGAYHAGVLRAFHEAGVKIDIVAGAGIGAAGAIFAAVDGGARLWDAKGLWRGREMATLYRWRPALRAAGWMLLVLVAALLVPVAAVLAGAVVYPTGLVLEVAGLPAGAALVDAYGGALSRLFESRALPLLLPRFLTLIVLAAVGTLLASAALAAARSRVKRRLRGPVWWRVMGAPLSHREAADRFATGLWQLIRGAASIAQPDRADLGRRYAELLADNLGQPGYRELLVAAHDLDARRDIVFALLAEPYRRAFFRPEAGRAADTLDLAGVGREHVLDALGGVLSLPVATDPHLMTYAPDSFWRGETHRLCAREGAIGRLFDEVAAAGAEQVILVTATEPPGGPHGLTSARMDPRSRMGETLASAEAAAVRDALATRHPGFEAAFVIRPGHNPLGPFDFHGCYDDRSDRIVEVGELLERGYEDAYRQFIDPVVGASGEKIAPAGPDRRLRP